MCPATMPSRSTYGLFPSTTLSASSTHGRYGAVKLKMPSSDMLTYWLRRAHTYTIWVWGGVDEGGAYVCVGGLPPR
jgi:hypothetical protein